MPSPFLRTVPTTRCRRIVAAVCLIAASMPPVFAQDDKGCEGVGFAKHSPTQYSLANLRKRLERNPADVDALINLGIDLEEQDQINQAYALYQRAIQAKPDCSLGYLFAGLVEERIGGTASSDAEVKIRKALSLDPSLRRDGNVESFLKRHAPIVTRPPSDETRPASSAEDLLAFSNHFLIGVGIGILLAMPFLYVARRRWGASG